MKKILMLGVLLIGLNVNAHEGHDHDAPVSLRAPKGGMIKALDEARIEVVTQGSNLKIYIYDKDLQPLESKDFVVEAAAEWPRNKKTEPLKLTSHKQYLEANYEAKGTHRYTLKLKITDKKFKEAYDLSFVIEPRR